MDRLGIDIGTVSVKYLRWRGKKGKGIVISKGSYPYTGDYNNLAEILDDITLKEGNELEVSVALSSQDIQKRIFTIPILPKNELNDALNWSVSKLLSSPLEEFIYEFSMLGEIEERGTKKQEAIFTGIQKTDADNILRVINQTGFQRLIMFTDIAFTFAPIMEKDDKHSFALIDVGGRQTGIYIFHNKKLCFVRDIMTASESFTDALMSGLNLSYDDAERYKRDFGFHEDALIALNTPLERLSGEIERTFNVYNQRYRERQIKRISITGGGSKIPGFINKLSGLLTVDIEPLQTPPDIDDNYLPSYNLCLYSEWLVNLLPSEMKEIVRQNVYKKWIRIGTVAIASLLVIFSLNIMNRLNSTNIALNAEKNILQEKKKQYDAHSRIAAASTQYNEFVAIQKEIQKKDVTFLSIMKYLSSTLTENIHIKELEFDRYNKIMASIPRDPIKEALKKDEKAIAESMKIPGLTGDPQKDAAAATAAKKASEALEQEYGIKIIGYIYGDTDTVEASLMSTMVRLQKIGFLYNIDIAQKEVKDIKGQNTLEFVLTARCMKYEI